MADCFRSCGRPFVGMSTNYTLSKDNTGTSHRLACYAVRKHPSPPAIPSQNGTFNDQPATCPSPATTVIRVVGGSALAFVSPHAHCLYCLVLSEGHPGEPSLYFGTRVLGPPGCVLIIGLSTSFQRFGDTPSLLGWTTSRSPDWSTVVGSILRQTLIRPRRTAMTLIA
ncbi:uncharacterized protein SCHCODRAFT_02513932 [Schizophyllum commune H4-8]|uniref:Expressed protein n=1 Tax=Schizophyllum commune (strain H4-8 / FGSC 9210) TaxID=578458 RepID=D8QG33_SCHCM|nr:uncharacterized protein SCHCODRAFT_02513932 [Schizophyllum commune H4-8]KAI5887888.1 hypothetical protein SCHCODRAFT_02513932 [Schizophyllum commune H4-8]